MDKILLFLFLLLLNASLASSTSISGIPVANYSSLSGTSEIEPESEQFLDAAAVAARPHSMEDLASKEKVILPSSHSHQYPSLTLRPPLPSHPNPDSVEVEDDEIPEESSETGEESSLEESEEENEEQIRHRQRQELIELTTPLEGLTSGLDPANDTVMSPNFALPNVSQIHRAPENPVPVEKSTLPPDPGSQLSYSHPLPLVKAPFDEEIDEKLFLILQNSVRETYFAFRDILGNRHRIQIKTLEDDLRSKLSQLDVDLNVKVVALDTTTHSRIQTLTDQIIDQRKEDIQTFSDNLHQLQKTHQMHMDSQKMEIAQLQVTMDLLNKGQSSLATKLSQLQKVVNNLDSKVNEMVIKSSEDLNGLKDGQKLVAGILDELQLDIKTNDAEFRQVQEIVTSLQKAATEDHGKLRRTLIRDQKVEPLQVCIRHLKNKNIPAALKQWRTIESIADDLKETLPSDISKIIEESTKHSVPLPTLSDFIHRAIGHGDRRLKEAAYSTLLSDMENSRSSALTDAKRTIDIFNLAQVMKADLGPYYNSSIATVEIVAKLPEIIKLITFDKVRLLLPARGYLRVASDRKVSLVPVDGRFYDRDEILWQFEYDKDKADGTFYIKSDKAQKYLVTLQEGFNSYGFSKQGLFVTGNKKENGTRFQITIVNQGEYVLFKSVYYNGYITFKSNVQTVYGDDDSYFLLLVDRKNGPSPYWNILGAEDA